MHMESARSGMSRDAAWAVIGAALLLCPALALAQSSNSPSTIRSLADRSAPKPVCVYKGVMSDAEVEACTGHPVHYDYRIRKSNSPVSLRTPWPA